MRGSLVYFLFRTLNEIRTEVLLSLRGLKLLLNSSVCFFPVPFSLFVVVAFIGGGGGGGGCEGEVVERWAWGGGSAFDFL